MKKQTAVEYLESKIFGDEVFSLSKVFEQALEIEKEQIEDAYKEGRNSGQANWGYGNDTTSEQYFNETFKK